MEIQNQYNLGSIFAFYASLTASLNLAKQFYHQFTPSQIREYINEKIQDWFSKQNILDPKLFTLEIAQNYDEEIGYSNHNNTIYYACESHLTKKLRSSSTRLKLYRSCAQQPLTYHLAQGEEFSEYVKLDEFGELIKLHWKFSCKNEKGEKTDFGTYRYFELIFDPRFKEAVLDHYLPEVLVKNYDKMIEMTKEINLFTFNDSSPCKGWRNVVFNHPFTFDALALDPDFKKSIVDDLDRFIRRKEFYKRIGRAWKRGYLLYGPPGTGKSSLIAAFANYLKFDVYDLQLASVDKDDTLRNLMMSISNKSILVIEDIDCASGLARNVALSRANVTSDDSSFTSDDDDTDDDNRNNNDNGGTISFDKNNTSLSLSGLLNFIDGLWSSCGDERIIILTTNYKERLDPALLRPGRMDMHIHMSYLRMPGFRVLASNYLGQTEEHPLFEEIEELLEKTNVSPAEVAEELIRSEDPDVALKSVLNLLNKKTKKRKVTKEKVDVLSDELDDEPLTKKQRNGDELNCYNGEC